MTSDEIKFDSEALYQTDCIIYEFGSFFFNLKQIKWTNKRNVAYIIFPVDNFNFLGFNFYPYPLKYKIFIPETKNVIEFILWNTANNGKDVRAYITLHKNCNY